MQKFLKRSESLRTFKIGTNAEKSNVDLLIKAYLRYLHPETETAIMKSNFQIIKQKKGESITKFIGRIYEMAMKAYMGKIRQSGTMFPQHDLLKGFGMLELNLGL